MEKKYSLSHEINFHSKVDNVIISRMKRGKDWVLFKYTRESLKGLLWSSQERIIKGEKSIA